MSGALCVFIVDDDEAVRTSLSRSLGERGYAVEAFPSARAFLEATGGRRPGCLVLDVRMPDISGMELQMELRRLGLHVPIVFITAHGDVPMAVRALKRGAVDFLEKPYRIETLVARIDEALRLAEQQQARADLEAAAADRLQRLTGREREVFELLTAEGSMSNKEIARTLGISHRTVEVHRRRIMRKLEADSVPDLISIAALQPGSASRDDN